MSDKFIYVKKYEGRRDYFYQLKFIKETPTQIVASHSAFKDAIIRFDKKTGKEKGCTAWQYPMEIITKEQYSSGVNDKIYAKIALREKEIVVLKVEINNLRAQLVI